MILESVCSSGAAMQARSIIELIKSSFSLPMNVKFHSISGTGCFVVGYIHFGISFLSVGVNGSGHKMLNIFVPSVGLKPSSVETNRIKSDPRRIACSFDPRDSAKDSNFKVNFQE